jgi:hypothetical protein
MDMDNMRDRAAILVAANWRIQKRLPRITERAAGLGLIALFDHGTEEERLQRLRDHAEWREVNDE